MHKTIKIKRMTLVDLILALIVMTLIIIPIGIVGHYETHYTMDCIVIDTNDDIVTVVDLTCQEWDFVSEDFEIDDVVKVTFENYGSSKRFDDKIVKVEKMDYEWED